jgi:hypothetical protein
MGNTFSFRSALLLLDLLLGLWARGQRFFSVVHISTDLLLGLAQAVAARSDNPKLNRSEIRGPTAVGGDVDELALPLDSPLRRTRLTSASSS